MNDRTRSVLVLLPWLSVPLTALSFLLLWRRIPGRLAVHFDGGGAPDGWMSRRQFVAFALGVLVFVLSNFTLKLLSGREPDKFNVRLVFYYAGTALLLGVFAAVLRHNF
jgi:hypothetical protein